MSTDRDPRAHRGRDRSDHRHGLDRHSQAGFNADILMSGEAADICSSAGDVPTPSVRLTNGLLVAPYWSNADNACEPITHTFHLGETGLPLSVPHQATFDGKHRLAAFQYHRG